MTNQGFHKYYYFYTLSDLAEVRLDSGCFVSFQRSVQNNYIKGSGSATIKLEKVP